MEGSDIVVDAKHMNCSMIFTVICSTYRVLLLFRALEEVRRTSVGLPQLKLRMAIELRVPALFGTTEDRLTVVLVGTRLHDHVGGGRVRVLIIVGQRDRPDDGIA